MSLISGCFCFDLIAVIVTLIVGAIAFLKWKFTYWERHGLPTLPPSIPMGNATDILMGRKSWGETFAEYYKTFRQQGYQHCGFYLGVTPTYVPLDPELVKHIMQTDFAHFNSHGGYLNEEHDPLSGHLFNLTDDKWRNLRVKLTPTFTSGKMKMMFHTITTVSQNLKEVMDESIEDNAAIDVRDLLGRFGTDVISSVAFGLDTDSLKNPDAPFRHFGKRAADFDLRDKINVFKQVILPDWVLNLLKHKFTKPDVEEFFLNSIKKTVEYREKNNIYRKDFMHLLLQLKNRGTVSDDGSITDETGEIKEVALTVNQLAAQAFVFFMAGYETTASTLSFALCELAENTKIQDKLRKEIKTVLEEHDGEVNYDSIMKMTYLEKVLFETLRKYPPLPILTRLCTKDYTVPNTDVFLKKGTTVVIPALGIHSDPEIYPNPDVFDPERFSEENKQSRPGYTWLPFGDGPRICIGMRFGILQSKIALTTFLRNYEILLNEKTKYPIVFDKTSFTSKVEGGVWLNLKKLEDTS